MKTNAAAQPAATLAKRLAGARPARLAAALTNRPAAALASLFVSALLALPACGTQSLGTGQPTQVSCSSCHGSAENPAPPRGLDGETSTTTPQVGAHQAHLHDSAIRSAIACSECHPVPAAVDSPGHADGVIQFSWGPLATANGAQPVWLPASFTCATTYCHGGTLNAGGSNTVPLWTKVDGTQAACGTCHGNPPPSPHPARADCTTCHPQTVSSDGSINVAGGAHIDGVVEVISLQCNSCHGNAVNNAPPIATTGATSTTDITVGAHQSHLQDSAIRKALQCIDCHVVPTAVDSPGHIVNGPAPVIFGVLAHASGSVPAWNPDPVTPTCSNVYCHGAQAPGGSNKSPIWTEVDGTQAACGTCHGNPPPAPHPARADCNTCHSLTVLPSGLIDVAGGHHIDGVLDVSVNCSSCHGSAANPAPPVATTGATSTTDIRVGAHQAHVTANGIHAPLACSECHIVPAPGDLSHTTNTGPAPVVFGALASFDGGTPMWNADPTTPTCSNVYCHGSQAPGGANKTPIWTQVDGTQEQCGSCHGNPPPFPHPTRADCNSCHSATVLPDGGIDIAGGHHIDGVLDVAVTCTSCHGSAANAAPPVATTGATSTTDIHVGAHQAHLVDGPYRLAMACTDCHVVPAPGDLSHTMNSGPAPVVFGTLATTGGSAPSWNLTAPVPTCSNVYCHGDQLSGGTNRTPIWTEVDGTQAACGTCHGNPPPAPHPQNPSCNQCHPLTVTPAGEIDVDGGYHINGTLEVTPQ